MKVSEKIYETIKTALVEWAGKGKFILPHIEKCGLPSESVSCIFEISVSEIEDGEEQNVIEEIRKKIENNFEVCRFDYGETCIGKIWITVSLYLSEWEVANEKIKSKVEIDGNKYNEIIRVIYSTHYYNKIAKLIADGFPVYDGESIAKIIDWAIASKGSGLYWVDGYKIDDDSMRDMVRHYGYDNGEDAAKNLAFELIMDWVGVMESATTKCKELFANEIIKIVK